MIEAMKQALEALEFEFYDDNIQRKLKAAITALRTAIEQAEKQEPVAASADTQIAAHAKRLALELECLLLSCEETAVVSKWWASAHQALGEYQDDIDRLYPQEHVSPLGKD